MGIFRAIINPLLPLVPRFLIDRVAQPYVAGDNLQAALETVERNHAQGYESTLALLGEEVRDESIIREVVDEYCRTLEKLHERGLSCGLSIKATHLGLRINRDIALECFRAVAETARTHNTFIRLDMEDSSTTEDILWIYKELKKDYARCGVVLQAMLKRTESDIDDLLKSHEAPDVRICKGIYTESEDVAYLEYERVRESFKQCVRKLMEGGARVGIATHDPELIDELFKDLGSDPDSQGRYELQTLLGVPVEKEMQSLVQRGQQIRVYIPYGPDWYAYSMRRLKENPKIMAYVIHNFFKKGFDISPKKLPPHQD